MQIKARISPADGCMIAAFQIRRCVAGRTYVEAMCSAFQYSLSAWFGTNPSIYVMANAHSGPPSSSDNNYADQEAGIFIQCCQIQFPTLKTGFGQESLSEYDLNYPTRPCTDDWCKNFSLYYGGTQQANLYLQTTEPNTQVSYAIQSISRNFPYQNTGLVTCMGTCTNSAGAPVAPGAEAPIGIYSPEGFALSPGAGPNKTTYHIAETLGNPPTQGILNSTQFTCDATTPCPAQSGGTLYVGDYLPDTIPFAAANYADTIEVYFCDWEFAFNPNSGTAQNFCQLSNSQSKSYAAVLNKP